MARGLVVLKKPEKLKDGLRGILVRESSEFLGIPLLT